MRHTLWPSSMVACERGYWARTISLVLWGSVALLPREGIAAEDREQWQQPDRVVADLGLKEGVQVADVGCGTGYFTLRIAKTVGPKGKVFAVDTNADALKKLREQAGQDRFPNIEIVLSQPTDTKLPAQSLDAALFCNVLHEVPEAGRLPLVQDVSRAIKPGGFLFLIDFRKSHEVPFDPYDRLIPRDDLVKLGADAGLVLDAECYYLKYQVFLRFRKP